MFKKGTCFLGIDWFLVDKEHQIESKSLAFHYRDAEKYFEETVNSKLGKFNWID